MIFKFFCFVFFLLILITTIILQALCVTTSTIAGIQWTAAAGKEDEKKKEGSRCVTTHLESSIFSFLFFSFTLLMPIYDRPQKKGGRR